MKNLTTVTVGQWLTQLHSSASGDVNDIGVTLSIELDGDAQSQKQTQQQVTRQQTVQT